MDERNVANLNETYHERIKRGEYCPSDGTTPGGTQRVRKIVVFHFLKTQTTKSFNVTKI